MTGKFKLIIPLAVIAIFIVLLLIFLSAVPAFAPGEPAPTATEAAPPTSTPGALDLMEVPVLPDDVSERAREIYAAGIAEDRDPNRFAKVGDCMTHSPLFFVPLDGDSYALGDHEDLAEAVERFAGSFERESLAAAQGFNVASTLDRMWANPEFCESSESPLICEYRESEASIAVIMFGTNDILVREPEQFETHLRTAVERTIEANVLPILSTFPDRPDQSEKVKAFNEIIVQIAREFDIPLLNLWRTLEPLDHHGVDPDDPTHLTAPEDGNTADFTEEGLAYGFNVRNLVTLQALDRVWRALNE
jgi:hypothetical protein